MPPLRAVGGDTGNAGRGTKQEEDKDSGLGRAHHDAVRSGSPSGESSVRESGKGAGQGDRLGKRNGTGRKGSAPIFSDGINQLSALTQRLLKRWKSRGQSVSEPPSAHKSESSGPTRQGTLKIQCNLFSAPCLGFFSHVLAPRARVKMVWCKVKLLIDVLRFTKNGFSVFFNVPQHVAILEFALGPYRFLWFISPSVSTTRTNEESIQGPCMVQHVAMVEIELLDSAVDRAMVVGREGEGARGEHHEKIGETFQRLTLRESHRRMVIKERNSGPTPRGILRI